MLNFHKSHSKMVTVLASFLPKTEDPANYGNLVKDLKTNGTYIKYPYIIYIIHNFFFSH